MENASLWIERLALRKHPEGGWYRETYRAAETIPADALPERFRNARPFSTAIYFLLAGDEFSAFHRLKSDEIWHFYAGTPLILHTISPEGRYSFNRLGPAPENNQALQLLVPAGWWQAAELSAPRGFALLGCTVAPGFDFTDFELAVPAELIRICPSQRPIIERLTRGQKNSDNSI